MRRRILGTTLGLVVTNALLVGLTQAPAHADNDDDPLCYTTRSTVDSSAYSGPSASRIYDWYDSGQTTQRFKKDVKIPDGLIDGRYVPQGLTAWPNWNGTSEDLLLISAYKQSDDDDATDGPSRIWGVVAGGSSRVGESVGHMNIAEGHVGGIALHKGFVYVGSGQSIRIYKASRVRSVLSAANVSTVYSQDRAYTTSYTVGYLGTGGGYLWAGQFDQDSYTHLNAYAQTSSLTGALAYRFQYFAPVKTQGVAVYDGKVIFATSHDRNDRGNLWLMKTGESSRTDGNSTCFRVPSMIEGVTVLNGRFYALYESGAWAYNKGLDDPDNPIYNLHSAPVSWVTGLYLTISD